MCSCMSSTECDGGSLAWIWLDEAQNQVFARGIERDIILSLDVYLVSMFMECQAEYRMYWKTEIYKIYTIFEIV